MWLSKTRKCATAVPVVGLLGQHLRMAPCHWGAREPKARGDPGHGAIYGPRGPRAAGAAERAGSAGHGEGDVNQ